MNPLLPLLYLAFHHFSVTAFPQDPNKINTGSLGDFLVSSANGIGNSQSDSNTVPNALVSPVIQNAGVTVPGDSTSLKKFLPQSDPTIHTDTDASSNPTDTTPHDAFGHFDDVALDPANILEAPQDLASKTELPMDCITGVLACCYNSFNMGRKFCKRYYAGSCDFNDWMCCYFDLSDKATSCSPVKWPKKSQVRPKGVLDRVIPNDVLQGFWPSLEEGAMLLLEDF